jgi:hypothetical protein
VLPPSNINALHRQTDPTAQVDGIGLSRAVANRTGPPADPPDKKRNPGSVGAERGADRNSKVSLKQSTKWPRQAQEPDRDLAIYSGRKLLGRVKGIGKRFRAILPEGIVLGRFSSLKSAIDAISAAHGGGQ